MQFWIWDTEEMLDLVKWMKEYNDKHTEKILFTGIDMQFYKAAIAGLRSAFKKYNIQYSLDDIEARLARLYSVRRRYDSVERSFNVLKDWTLNLDSVKSERSIFLNKERYFFSDICSKLDLLIKKNIEKGKDQEWLLQHVEIIRQFSDKTSPIQRDSYMAKNLLWIKDQNPHSKIIVWAHNGHIQKDIGKMGGFLDEKLKDAYLSIGFTFFKGSYTATGENGVTSYEAETAYPGSYEYYFHQVQQPSFLIDLKQFNKTTPEVGWLYNSNKFRFTGVVHTNNDFTPWDITKTFDALVFIDQSSPSTLIFKKH